VTLKDVIKPNQIHYECKNKNSKYHLSRITQVDIDKAILEALEYFKVSESEYNKYVDYCNNKLDSIEKDTHEKIASKNLEIGRLKAKKKQYQKNNMSLDRDKEEEIIYQETKSDYDRKINILRNEIKALDE